MTSRCLFFIGTLFWMAMWGFAVNSAEQEPNAEEAAKEFFHQGKSLFLKEKYDEAAASFRAAMAHNPSWKIYYNIGQCEAAAKRYGLALEAFELYLANAGDHLDIQREDEVQSEIARLKLKVGNVVVTGPPGAIVRINGVERGTLPILAPLRVAAGVKHDLLVTAGANALVQEVIYEEEIMIWSGDQKEIAIAVAQEKKMTISEDIQIQSEIPEHKSEQPLPDARESDAEQQGGRSRETADKQTGQTLSSEELMKSASIEKNNKRLVLWRSAWITGIAGGVTLIGGGIATVITARKASYLDDHCPGKECTNPDDQDVIDAGERAGTTATILLASGGALVVSSAVLFFVWKKKEQLASMTTTPLITKNFVGLQLEGRF